MTMKKSQITASMKKLSDNELSAVSGAVGSSYSYGDYDYCHRRRHHHKRHEGYGNGYPVIEV